MEEDKDSSRGFRVTDRRRFTDDSEAHEETHASEEAEAAAPEPEPAAPGAEPGGAGGQSSDEPVSFSTFILGLSTQALLHLGDIESPVSGKVERDLGAAAVPLLVQRG